MESVSPREISSSSKMPTSKTSRSSSSSSTKRASRSKGQKSEQEENYTGDGQQQQKQQLSQKDIELEQKREASRISSRRSQERQKRRIVFLSKEETRLTEVNAKNREENDLLRSIIRDLKRRRATVSSNHTAIHRNGRKEAIPRLDQNKHSELSFAPSNPSGKESRADTFTFLLSQYDQHLSELAATDQNGETALQQELSSFLGGSNNLSGAGILDTATSLLNRNQPNLGLVTTPAATTSPTFHPDFSSPLSALSPSLLRQRFVNSSSSSSHHYHQQASATSTSAVPAPSAATSVAGIINPNSVQQQLFAIEEAIRQSHASLAATRATSSSTLPVATSLEQNLKSLISRGSGSNSSSEIVPYQHDRTSLTVGEMITGSIRNNALTALGTGPLPLGSAEGSQYSARFTAQQQSLTAHLVALLLLQQQQQQSSPLRMTDAARSRLNLNLLLGGSIGRELAASCLPNTTTASQASIGLLSNSLPTLGSTPALQLQRFEMSNPSVAAAALHNPTRLLRGPAQTSTEGSEPPSSERSTGSAVRGDPARQYKNAISKKD